MKRILRLSFILLFAPVFLMAQEKKVTGIVSSVSDGILPGVSVLVKGTSQGTVTDAQGKFSVTLSNPEAVLVFSAIGFTPMEVAVKSKTTLDILMETDSKLLNEVVVTALGISREKKSLGFSQQEVKGESLTESRSTNVANALSGKVAGVRISANGGPGSGSTIQIRGSSSVSGNNQPLIVVDGVPLQQDQNKQFGGGISEINPDNIKEISVLKGPNAAA
ncbi:MAG: TonB-dependent receptor plug domain-containing protein, partial [Leadbetterella sp.]|nr:TonB-dependent receptor plug domain-containing protein [Leadbetterella sp.]